MTTFNTDICEHGSKRWTCQECQHKRVQIAEVSPEQVNKEQQMLEQHAGKSFMPGTARNTAVNAVVF